LPEDVTGVSTLDIVKRIRCETRAALVKELMLYVGNLARGDANQPPDSIAQAIVADYENDPESIRRFSPARFPGPRYIEVRRLINAFADAGIAYNFDLTMTEDNNLTTDINLLRPLTNSATKLGISAGAARKRNNHRVFTLTDTFRYLVLFLPTEYCDGQIVHANYIYPITGRIGVDRLVHDFVAMTLFGNLGGAQAQPSGPPTMADTLTFTTRVNISATPRVEFTPVDTSFQLANAQLMAEAIRTDMHEVSVALAITPLGVANLTPLRAYLFSAERLGAGAVGARSTTSSLVVGERVTGGGSPSEKLAVLAIDQLKRRELQLLPPQ
jgi:hypothetical protein